MTDRESYIEDFFLKAAESENNEDFSTLLHALSSLGNLNTESISDSIVFLLESWGNTIENSESKANFCLELARLSPPDIPVFRNALSYAMKKLFPPKLSGISAAASTGLRDTKVSLPEIALRFDTLRHIDAGLFCYHPNSKNWGIITKIDELTGTLSINNAFIMGEYYSIPLAVALSEFKLFQGNIDFKKLIRPEKIELPSTHWSNKMREYSLSQLNEELLKSIAFSAFVPLKMNREKFEQWWSKEKDDDSFSDSAASISEHLSSVRSLHELHSILKKMYDNNLSCIETSQIEKLSYLFISTKPSQSLEEQIMAAESISIICSFFSGEDINKIFAPIKEHFAFWPLEDKFDRENLNAWSAIPVKFLSQLIRSTSILFSKEYLAHLCLSLPLRCWNPTAFELGKDFLFKTLADEKHLSADALLWIWKNRKDFPDSLLSKINLDNVLISLSKKMSASWVDARKELKKLLIENEEFQRILLKDDNSFIIKALESSDILVHGEIQSLLVKLSRLAPELRDFLEKRKGRGLLPEPKNKLFSVSADDREQKITSRQSYNIRMKELEDIVKRQIPENTAAIAHARSYGDLRENAEYSAARERQRFLLKRREELEFELHTTQSAAFENINPAEAVVIGSTVLIKLDSGNTETYYLLGIWDTNPGKNMISYDSSFGRALLGKKADETVTLPDGEKGCILQIKSLPEALQMELADEQIEDTH